MVNGMRIDDVLSYIMSDEFYRKLERIYGDNATSQRERYRKVVTLAKRYLGSDADVVVSRAPGRVNLMGRHIDYMGGYVNPIATSDDIISVLEKRKNDTVVLYNTDPNYKSGSFRISEELPKEKIESLADWDKWTVKMAAERSKEGKEFTWIDYVKGLFIYLQVKFKDEIKLDGFNIVVDGTIPSKRGMSSSSALVVSVAMALRSIYNFKVSLGEFIDIVGYSEWYRLTRGGTADHAAIILSKKNYVSHIKCLPTVAEEVTYAPLPKGYSIYLIDSGVERPHTEEAFNYLRVTAASYRIGVLLLKSLFPEYADKIVLLRDFNTRNLGINLVDLYGMLKKIPEKATRRELWKMVNEKYHDELNTIFTNHNEPQGGYRLRENILYGIAETERARIFPYFLKMGDISKILRLIEVSHDGDRVSIFDKELRKKKWDSSIFSSNEKLDEYIRILTNSDDSVKKERVQLHWIPGGYGRSIEEIDFICDYIRNNYASYAAAQIMGAGLGGNVLVLVKREKASQMLNSLKDVYKEYYGIDLQYMEVKSGEGACVLLS